MNEPRTEAGRRLGTMFRRLANGTYSNEEVDARILAIEQEANLAGFVEGLEHAKATYVPSAVAAREAEIRAAVEELPYRKGITPQPRHGEPTGEIIDRAAVLAAIGSPAPAPRLDRERLARALNATVGANGWMRSTPADPVEEWRMNAAAIADAYEADHEGL